MKDISSQGNVRFTNEQLCCDIVDRKRTEAELETSLSLLQATLESTASGVIAFSCRGDIVSFNQKIVEIWQIPNKIITSRKSNELLAFCSNQLKDPETLTRRVQELRNQPAAEGYDTLDLKNGRILEQHFQPLRLGEQIIGRVWSVQDITEHKRTEEELLGVLLDRLEKQAASQQWFAAQSQGVSAPPSADTGSPTTPQSIFPTYPQLTEVFQFIEANYHKQISLQDVAQVVGYSRCYLTQLVRRLTGKPLYRWIVERRMAEACSLLLETSQTVEQIAKVVGYHDPAHFFHQFRQLYGTTPLAWRKSHRSQYIS